MTDTWNNDFLQPAWSRFKKITTPEDWFEVYEVAPNLIAFFEARHYEATIASLVIGQDKAALIDTGCGIGSLRNAVEAITAKPVIVINTHTHLDHLGSNRQFDEIAMFDHPLPRRIAENGVDHQTLQTEILAENLIIKPLPQGFDPNDFALPPLSVSRWLKEGDRIELGGRDLEVIYTPGEAADHISLLDRTNRILFCGDILLNGAVWTHLEGGSVTDLLLSYRKLMGVYDAFDHLMPGHNAPWLAKELLPASLDGAEKVVAGEAEYEIVTDPWNKQLRKYAFDQFSILTRDAAN